MTREEHIRVAEWLLTERRGEFGAWHPTEQDVAIAHVHATLALAIPPEAGRTSSIEIRSAVPR